MPTDTLTLPLTDVPAYRTREGVTLVPLHAADRDELAVLYLASYPPGVAVADLAEAQQEMAVTFAGDYGVLRPDASAVAVVRGGPVGAVMVVERSLWDPELDGPFVIELFVTPAARGCGAGRALMEHAIRVSADAGDPALSLRVGDGTSDAARALYASLGFVPVRA